MSEAATHITIGLNAVLAALDGDAPKVLCVERSGGWGLPFGRFDPSTHRTFELGLRDFVDKQTAIPLGYVEQLYTFGDMGRESPRATMKGAASSDHIVSVGYLALAPEAAPAERTDTAWHDWYTYFPWEDRRDGRAACLDEFILPALQKWAGRNAARRARLTTSFGLGDIAWEEERALDRYELMYEAGLVMEADRDGWTESATHMEVSQSGAMMISDHRRILATAIGRLRGKLRYRPIVFEMMPPLFTLTDLQTAVETILGFAVHKQNFRRGVLAAGLVEKTEQRIARTGGRPAALYARRKVALEKHTAGLTLPRLRETPPTD